VTAFSHGQKSEELAASGCELHGLPLQKLKQPLAIMSLQTERASRPNANACCVYPSSTLLPSRETRDGLLSLWRPRTTKRDASVPPSNSSCHALQTTSIASRAIPLAPRRNSPSQTSAGPSAPSALHVFSKAFRVPFEATDAKTPPSAAAPPPTYRAVSGAVS